MKSFFTFAHTCRHLSRVLLVITCLVGGGNFAWGDEITIYKGGGESNNSIQIPVYGDCVQSYLTECEFYIPKDSLGSVVGNNITKLTFYLKTPSTNSWTNSSFKLFLEEISSVTYTTSNVSFKRSTTSAVYTGSLDATGSTMEIVLDNAFPYTGTGHLLVAIEQTVLSTTNSRATFYAGTSNYSYYRGAYKSSSTGGHGYHIRGPRITLTYEEPSSDTPVEVTAPEDLQCSSTTPTSATFTWTSDETRWQMSYSTVSGDHETTTADFTSKPYTLTGLTPDTRYYASIRAKNGSTYSDWSDEINFTTDAKVAVESVTLNTSSATLLAGGTRQLTATVAPNNATYLEVTWTSSDEAVATVSAAGLVTAVAPGSCTITVKANDDNTKLATCDITVTAPVTPTAFKTKELTKDYVYLTWTNGSTETDWNIKYGTTSGSLDKESGYINSSKKPYLITGLTSNTTYYASIRSKLGTAESDWSEEISFTTPTLGPAPVGSTVTIEEFESGWTVNENNNKLTALKTGWGNSGSTSNFIISTTYKHNGEKGLSFEGYNTNTYFIITPEVEAGSTISFWSCRASSTAYGAGKVNLYKVVKIGNNYYVDTNVIYASIDHGTTNGSMTQTTSAPITEGGYVAICIQLAAIDDITYTALPTVSAITDNYGYTTFGNSNPLDLTRANLPSGLKAYKASVNNEKSKVIFATIDQTVSANTGMLLEGEPNTQYQIAIAGSGTDVENNEFLVNTTGYTFAKESGYTYYGMIKNSNPLTFGTFDPSTVAIPSNKAYLKVSSTQAARLTCSFDSETTGIGEAQRTMIDGGATTVFDLQGRRVSVGDSSAERTQLPKGVYIVNGRKVVVK